MALVRKSIRHGLQILTAVTCMAAFLPAQEAPTFTQAERNHWAFQPIERSAVPQIDLNVESTKGNSTARNPIDCFINAGLDREGTQLAHEADRSTLIRRLTFDLIGLPPSPTDVAEFVADQSPDAYERLVDRLLASPHYGEAVGRDWLDVVRFAETAGFKEDPLRPRAFTYRDYVIRAFNRDLPLDRFVADQLAGDELFPDDPESLAATAYCRMWPDESNASNILLARQTSLDDLTGNVGAVFLGLSIGCAQCHDHKFDPILQTDFYQLQAFFSGIVLEDRSAVGSHQQLDEFRRAERAWLDQTASLRHELNLLERPARIKMQGERRMKFPPEVLEALDTPLEDRTTMQRQLAFWSARQMGVKEDDIPKHLDDTARSRRDELLARLVEALKSQPAAPSRADVMAVSELTTTPPATCRMENGSYDKPREAVEPHYPVVLRSDATRGPLPIVPPNAQTSGRRTVLAQWFGASQNPLTHRVWINRIWQGHFGQGVVSNANDFGTQSPKPTLAALLDWMTTDFIEHGFLSKRMHRQIVESATYRQETKVGGMAGGPSSDYSGYPRRRLSSERIRDAWLMASGQLNDTMYGPGVRPGLPPNFSSYDWKVSEPSQQVRRSIYIFAKRNLPYPLMVAFDFPDMHESCGCRTKTTIAPQALMLLNNQIVIDAGRKLASRSNAASDSADPAEKVRQAWQIAFGRAATENEVESAIRFLFEQQTLVDGTSKTSDESSGPAVETRSANADEAFADLCHALLNANEFLFVE